MSAWDQSYDLGVVFAPPKNGSELVLRHAFEIVNDGSSVLMLNALDTSCGCTWPEVPRDGIQPGSSARVPVVIEPPSNAGDLSEWVLLQTNDPRTPKLRLTLSATVLARLETTYPGSTPVRVRPGETWRGKFQVRARQPMGDAPCDLRLASRDRDEHFEVRLGVPNRRSINNAYRLVTTNVEVLISCPTNIAAPSNPPLTHQLSFTFGDAKLDQVIAWVPDLPIVASPKGVFLSPRSDTDSPSARGVRLQASEAFAIIRLSTTSDRITVNGTLRERATAHELDVAARPIEPRPDGKPTSRQFEVIVTTDMPQQKIVRIPVSVLDTP